MAINFVTTSSIGSGARVTTAAGTPIFVVQGVTLGSTDGSAINGVTDVDITVAGTVAGVHGINMVQASGFSNITVTSTGVVSGLGGGNGISFGDGSNLSVTNYGSITAFGNAIDFNSTNLNASLLVANFGSIAGTGFGSGDGIVVGTAGSSLVYNFGSIGSADVGQITNNAYASIGNAVDTFINSGDLFGTVDLGNGNDIYDGRAGYARDTVFGGGGSDVLLGGVFDDSFFDTNGSNWIVGGAGDDTVTIANFGVANGVSTVYGGEVNGTDTSANDTLAVVGAGTGANIFLGGGAMTDAVTGNVFAWAMGFENATGTSFSDALIGSNGNNILQGGGGADWLVGNGGADTFRYATLSDAAAGETIADFNHVQGDVVDLAGIDANTAAAGDQAFTFVTTHTNNAAAQVVLTNFGGGARIDLYVDADNVIDATIFVAYGAATTTNMTVSDFIL